MSVFENIKELTGTRYHRANHNKDILDNLVLRRAREYEMRLPTGTEPDVWNFFGAYVETPTAGINRNVIYLDLSSLYPSIILACNVGPDTIVGTADDLADSPWTEDDCVWSYIDTRPVKHLDDGESWRDYTDGAYKMVYDPDQEKIKWRDDPQYTRCYYLKPSIRESFLRELVEDLIDLKYEYEGGLYEAVKRVVNSIFGFCSYLTKNTSSRIADWRFGESITLGGRKILFETRDTALSVMERELAADVYVSHGDSVPAEEPVLIRDGDGNVDVLPIEQLPSRQRLTGGVEVWTDDGFTGVNQVIRKPNRKQMYVVRTKNGVTHVTEDHSLVLADGTEVKPENVSEGDELLHRDLVDVELPDAEKTVGTKKAWLYGLFVADGTCRHYEYDDRNDKWPWAITKADKELLGRAQDILDTEWGVSTAINDTMESSGCYKLQTSDCRYGQRKELVDEFRERCYEGDEKRVPECILNGSREERESFLDGYIAGDGENRKWGGSGTVEFSSRSEILMTGLLTLFREQGWEYTVTRRVNHGGEEYYRVRVVSFHRGSPTEVISVEETDYEGDYVYDLETENGHFHAGIGSIVVHNTDGIGIACDSVASRDIMLDAAQTAATHLNEEGYGPFMQETFGVDGGGYMEVEVESFAPSVFVPRDFGADDPTVGVKKRYASWLTVKDGAEVDEIEVKGFEAKRSDIAPITREIQTQTFEWLLTRDFNDAWGDIAAHCREAYNAVRSGEKPIETVAKRGGIGQRLDEYGDVDRRPAPMYRGAKYADKHVDGVHLAEGSKPMCVYVDGFHSECSLPRTYTAETAEDGTPVDAISLEDPSRLPTGVQIDWDKHCQKAVVDPMDPIFRTLDKSWDDVKYDSEQADFSVFA